MSVVNMLEAKRRLSRLVEEVESGAASEIIIAREAFLAAGYRMLNVTPQHAAAVETLPNLHADPFDGMLIAQALHEPLRLLTADAALARYSDTAIGV
jgi:PIN domain nuclease of toxin-antitoxin system